MILGFILCFAPVALAGSLILRWFQLSFLYNNMEIIKSIPIELVTLIWGSMVTLLLVLHNRNIKKLDKKIKELENAK